MEKDEEFIVKEIIPMNSNLTDSTRVPHLPGLSDAGHCREWEAGVPIDLDAIRDEDEKYWDEYKGTPKAFVSTQKALEMWSNRFGNYTAVRYPEISFDREKYNQVFAQEISPKDLGMSIEPIREQGIHAAENGTDFSGLFIGLSFFLLLASIILTALVFRLNLETRSTQVGLLDALGFRQNHVRSFYIWEGLVISALGAATGLIASVFYTQLVFNYLNSLWFDIVRTNVLEIKILSSTLLSGLTIGVVVSLAAIYISIRRFQNRKANELQKQIGKATNKKQNVLLNLLMYTTLGVSGIIFIYQLIGDKQLNTSLFFLSGGLLLVGLLLVFRKNLNRIEKLARQLSTQRLVQLNLSRNKGRSLTIVILFALGTFLVVSTGSNKLDLFTNAQEKTSGTGGFIYFAETTMPVLFDINNEEKKAEEGIYEDFNVVQFRKVEGDDASCLNLNRIAQPAVLGVEPKKLENRFSFAAKMKGLPEQNPWLLLNSKLEDGTIPAIADQTVIQWGLGMKVGDILLYQNEIGDTLRLKLIAGTTPSIFQGFVIISNQHFLENYPTSSGSNLFLVEGSYENDEAIGNELNSVFRDYGWEMEGTAKRLAEFYSVTNTYLSIFLALGALGLILGTIGLAVILARSILERRREIALMQAVGFTEKSIFKTLVREYIFLLSVGVLLGFITAVIATLPSFLSNNTDASISTVAMVVSIILINGIVWIVGLSWLSLQNQSINKGLKTD
jgi:ABC-type antimicrobial peptide transport system permease subunit